MHWPERWPEAAAGDPSAVQLRSEFKSYGIHAYALKRVRHPVTAGQDVLRALLHSGEGHRRYFLHPRCAKTREALENYRATELGEGMFDPRSGPDAANHAYSHGADQVRYLAWALRRRLGVRGFVDAELLAEA